jgi:hypothetical protein
LEHEDVYHHECRQRCAFFHTKIVVSGHWLENVAL